MARTPARAATPARTAEPGIVTLTLDGAYAGQQVTMRIDTIRRKHLKAIEAAEPAKQTLILYDLIELAASRWTIRDATTGAPLPQPADGGVDELTTGQLMAIYTALNAYNEEQTNVPKPSSRP